MKTPVASFYVDPARLHSEQDEVFARSWQFVGHAGQLENPGDYFTVQLGREPLLFTNDAGTIRGFFNVCRHRAGPVALGCGRAQRLSCRYHGWTYDLAGQLLRTTEMDGAEDFDPQQIRLAPVAVHRFGPLLFAALDPATPAFDTLYPGVAERCAPLALEKLRYVTTRNFTVNANWKVYVDNYLEGYHIPLVHPGLNRELDYRQYITELGARHTLQYAPIKPSSAQHYGAGTALYYWLFPNLMLNFYEGQLQTNVVIPLDVDRTVVRFDWFAPEPLPDPQTDRRWRELAQFSEEVQAEDAQICEIVQRNIGSRAYLPGPYSPKRESGVRLFHSLMHAARDEG
ncbi:MAG TPA: aromatic ring-hydroxylating dioxygenase subunit alpha [Steroidobacteraceae bacterium]|jgi:choline monooxygenase